MPHRPMVFVDIDTQHDFLDPGGSLFIAGSQAIRPNLARLTNYARSRGIPVLASACAHEPDEPDPEPFPPHCLVGTPGADRIEETRWPGGLVLTPDDRFDPTQYEGQGPPAHLTVQKRRYDLFSHPEADRVVSCFARDDPRFVVYGVATDYCVACAVRGLRARGLQTVVVVDAIEAVDPASSDALLAEFDRLGADRATTAEICGDT